MIKSQPAVRETRVPSLGWEDPLKKGIATRSLFFFSILIYLGLRWDFGAVLGLSRVAASRSHCLAAEHGLSSSGAGAELLRGTWDLPGPGIKSTSPALADDSYPLDHQANPSPFILFGLFSTQLAGEEAEVCRGRADIT